MENVKLEFRFTWNHMVIIISILLMILAVSKFQRLCVGLRRCFRDFLDNSLKKHDKHDQFSFDSFDSVFESQQVTDIF